MENFTQVVFFENAGGNPDADFFARWDGHEWHGYPGFPGGFNRDVWDFVVRDAQDIYTTGAHLLNHWDGTSWHNYDPSIWGAGRTMNLICLIDSREVEQVDPHGKPN